MTLKEQILGAADRKPLAVPVPEWNTTVYLTEMDGVERDRWDSRPNPKEDPHWTASLLVHCLSDAEGNRICSLADDIPALAKRNGAVLARPLPARDRPEQDRKEVSRTMP
jgi:hypothetical protein